MKATKVKPTETIGDDLPILAFQIKRIMNNCAYDIDTKNEYVQWATGDSSRTSLRSITQAQAKKIIRQQEGLTQEDKSVNTENWASFTPTKPNPQKRNVLFSLMYQGNWTTTAPARDGYKEVPDLMRLSNFLKSEKSPVNKKLIDMEPEEIQKIIKAFKGIVKSIYK